MDGPIYRPWPEATILAELRVFNDTMRAGAGPEEIAAGLLALDFLTHASTVSDLTKDLIYGAEVEARMRIELMLADESRRSTETERQQKLRDGLGALLAGFQSLANTIDRARCRFQTVDELNAYLDRHRRAHSGA